ncbi:MAG: L,D-transpeptidase [Pseudolabrys sp.]
MRLSRFVFAVLAAMISAAPAGASVLIAIDKSAQQMTVSVDGNPLYVWPVSTGAPGYDTPSGEFKPFRMEKDHFSREWDDAPMPNSIFFTMQGHAIHGSGHIKAIGTPASHGCVRLEPKNAAVLYALVKQEKMANTQVVLTGETPNVAGVPVARRDRYQDTNIVADEDFGGTLLPRRTARDPRDPRFLRNGQAPYFREEPYAPPRRYYRYGSGGFPFGW